MRQIIVVAAAALIAAVLAVAGVVTFTELGPEREGGRVAETRTSAPPAPRPTVTVTEPREKPRDVPETVVPERPDQSVADANFLDLIAAHGITAPDDWAIEAGRTTCGLDYASAREYLTDGGLYDYHVQTFLDDWMITHGGC